MTISSHQHGDCYHEFLFLLHRDERRLSPRIHPGFLKQMKPHLLHFGFCLFCCQQNKSISVDSVSSTVIQISPCPPEVIWVHTFSLEMPPCVSAATQNSLFEEVHPTVLVLAQAGILWKEVVRRPSLRALIVYFLPLEGLGRDMSEYIHQYRVTVA